ncbi:uncharacterized protein CLUP02_05052 [Colletotrichum lupini]|uniref:Uncharacterized protein n=1 Tax=Colletotrichum lupini TaxID=145971 RepID=A0A9Q8SLI1_9PEZI|nr:uncharacterized protein CLUP02_05052 [Colletotrichum lupini]UQC79572.1 hypothetical protein CLUP02_05052 [Colletotrichum lupini]
MSSKASRMTGIREHLSDDLALIRSSPSSIYPVGFLEETLKTLQLLFPESEFGGTGISKRRRWSWYQKLLSKQPCPPIDWGLGSIGTLSAEARRIERFRFWRNRLIGCLVHVLVGNLGLGTRCVGRRGSMRSRRLTSFQIMNHSNVGDMHIMFEEDDTFQVQDSIQVHATPEMGEQGTRVHPSIACAPATIPTIHKMTLKGKPRHRTTRLKTSQQPLLSKNPKKGPIQHIAAEENPRTDDSQGTKPIRPTWQTKCGAKPCRPSGAGDQRRPNWSLHEDARVRTNVSECGGTSGFSNGALRCGSALAEVQQQQHKALLRLRPLEPFSDLGALVAAFSVTQVASIILVVWQHYAGQMNASSRRSIKTKSKLKNFQPTLNLPVDITTTNYYKVAQSNYLRQT